MADRVMSDGEQQAAALLADHLEAAGYPRNARAIRRNEGDGFHDAIVVAMQAYAAAASVAPFNGLSPAQAERLAMLAEECGETVQAACKILRHGYESTHPDGGPTNRAALHREVSDICAVASAMNIAGDIGGILARDVAPTWQVKLRFTHHQRISA